MNYQALARRGWPIGIGAVESGCRTRQWQRKRPGQVWTKAGLRHLDALEDVRDNGHGGRVPGLGLMMAMSNYTLVKMVLHFSPPSLNSADA